MSRFSLGVMKLRRDDRYAVPALDRTINLGENVFHCPEQGRAQGTDGRACRDELGISENFRARPIQAALASAGSFAVGAALPSEQPCLSLYL